MLLTSRYTLDKRSETMRADLARKAELVGVVRLPSSTFARQAGTEAVTDVLVLRRRERTLDHTPDEAWIHSTPIAVPGYQDVTVNVNQAVANDMPTHAVGDIRPVIGRFGGDFDVVFQGDTERIGERLRTLLSMQITHGRPPLQLGEMEPAERAEVIVRPDHVTPFEYSVDQRGVVWYGDGATVTEAAHGQGDEARRLRGMIRLRDLARELQRLELDPAHVDDPAVETKRKELDQAYDRFTGEFGRLNDRANRRAYDSEESGRHLVMALEETDEKGRFVGKAKCLSQRTISPVPPMPDHADSLDDALNISLDRAGRVDLELIARLADTTVEEAEAGLGDRIIRDPYTGTVMPAEDYLTGDECPFDLSQDLIDVPDDDFGVWYVDVMDHPDRWAGKMVHMKLIMCHSKKYPGIHCPGRFVMTCCENDIQFMGLIAKGMNLNQYQNRDWVEVTGRMAVEKHAAYKGKGPVMHVISIGPCEKPQQEVVTF